MGTGKESDKIARARASLEKKKAAVLRERARLKRLEVREAQAERKRETRRKILAGAFLLAHWTEEEIKAAMDDYLTKPRDRGLFGLPEKQNPKDHP